MREDELSEPDRKALVFIRAYQKKKKCAPSYTEIGRHLGLSHPNNAKRNCDRLVGAGFLKRSEIGTGSAGRPRALGRAADVDDLILPFRGSVSCGTGNEPEDGRQVINLRDWLKAGGCAVFRADGDSMLDEQIADGDLLVVSENPDPPTGSVVVAVIGENETMLCKKFVRRTEELVFLQARNGETPEIAYDVALIPFRFLGVLRNVVRKV